MYLQDQNSCVERLVVPKHILTFSDRVTLYPLWPAFFQINYNSNMFRLIKKSVHPFTVTNTSMRLPVLEMTFHSMVVDGAIKVSSSGQGLSSYKVKTKWTQSHTPSKDNTPQKNHKTLTSKPNRGIHKLAPVSVPMSASILVPVPAPSLELAGMFILERAGAGKLVRDAN